MSSTQEENTTEPAWPDAEVQDLFSEFHPKRANTSGYQAWFRRELGSRGIDVTAKTVSLWLRKGTPLDRIVAIEQVITELRAIVVERLEAKLKEVRG